jgi:hypothetical protein
MNQTAANRAADVDHRLSHAATQEPDGIDLDRKEADEEAERRERRLDRQADRQERAARRKEMRQEMRDSYAR